MVTNRKELLIDNINTLFLSESSEQKQCCRDGAVAVPRRKNHGTRSSKSQMERNWSAILVSFEKIVQTMTVKWTNPIQQYVFRRCFGENTLENSAGLFAFFVCTWWSKKLPKFYFGRKWCSEYSYSIISFCHLCSTLRSASESHRPVYSFLFHLRNIHILQYLHRISGKTVQDVEREYCELLKISI